MIRPALICFPTRRSARYRRGFTLIEVLVAVTLTLVMMAAVVEIFAIVGKSINNSRSTLEMSERIRAVASRLKLDLEGVTANMTPPGRPEEGKGYFEYIEGPIGPVTSIGGRNTDETRTPTALDPIPFEPDSTVGDRDDILQFTTRSRGEPFVGRGMVIADIPTTWGRDPIGFCQRYTTIIKSQVAEVSWFLRGTTLYRRVLLVSPSFDADIRLASPDPHEAEVPFKGVYVMPYRTEASRMMGYYNNYDLSVHWDANANRVGITGGVPDLSGGAGRIVCNTLADLTRRECRYAHPPSFGFPFALHNSLGWRQLGLPTLQECSHPAWPFPIDGTIPNLANLLDGSQQFDAWANQYPFTSDVDKETGAVSPPTTLSYPGPPPSGVWPSGTPLLPTDAAVPRYHGPRVAEDVILTNVLSFDVKAWDPEAPVVICPAYNNASLIQGDNGYTTELGKVAAGPNDPKIASRGSYVDLGYYIGLNPPSDFSTMPNPQSGLGGLRVWDTWSIHYEHDGVDQYTDGDIDLGTNGFDDNTDGVVDDPDEREAPPPYDAPLRGIQIKIRVFDPDSQKVREVTVRQDFMKK